MIVEYLKKYIFPENINTINSVNIQWSQSIGHVRKILINCCYKKCITEIYLTQNEHRGGARGSLHPRS